MMVASSTFVPNPLDATKFENVEALFRALLSRPVSSAADLVTWLEDRSELAAACSESGARLYIAMTCNTDDKAASQAYLAFIEQVEPRMKPLSFELDKRLVELAQRHGLDERRYGVLLRGAKADVDLFREENIPLQTELAKLGQKYDEINGAMTVQFDGQEKTLPQMARYQELTDRAVRESAWRAVAERRLRDVDAINAIYDEMISLRHKVASNSGFTSYVGFAYKEKHRFDYGVDACRRFHDGVEQGVVPLMRALERERAGLLKVDALRPWDLSVDVKGRGPLRPFEGGADMVRKSRVAFERLDGRLAGMFAKLGDGSERVTQASDIDRVLMDLDSRKGKAPGGYQYMQDRSRRPFIFMNAAGLHKDVETMVHEAGHAFHSMLCVDEPQVEYRHSPIEFAEVASMSMELLTMRHWGPSKDGKQGFYSGEEDFRRAMRMQLKRSVLLLPWIATIDAFQHFVYGYPTHTREERSTFWLGLDERFGSVVSWDGISQYRPNGWQRQLHLFSHPFYYIEYGIAQLGALQLWLQSIEKGESTAVESYIRALSLGGSKPLPELFASAGLVFDFGADTVKRLADRVHAELAKLPE
jgi:oligoendopeptidase F